MNNKKIPIISIIVPVYNVEKYLNRCIDSILNQTFTDFELILIDDGSPDNCGVICDEYAKKDKRIKVIHKENGGLSSARNRGLDVAKGNYIGFVDSDDYININMYECLYNAIIKNNSDISICNFMRVKEERVNTERNNIEKEYNYTNLEYIEELYKGNHVVTPAWNKLYKKNIFNNIRYPIGRIYEDAFIIHEILYNIKKITYIDSYLYYYYLSENSITRSVFTIKNLEGVFLNIERSKFFELNGMNKFADYSKGAFIIEFFTKYFKAKYEKNINKYELSRVKKKFKKELINLIINSNFSIREKFAWIIFFINENYYEKIFNNREVVE